MNESLHVVQIIALGDELFDTFCLLSIQAVVVGEASWTGEHRLGGVLHVLVVRAVIVVRVHERLILGLWRDSVIESPAHMTRSYRHGLRLTIRPLEKTLFLVEAGMGPVTRSTSGVGVTESAIIKGSLRAQAGSHHRPQWNRSHGW